MIDWLNDPMLKNMDPIKVELIKTAAAQTSGKSGRALAPVLMTLITNANKKIKRIINKMVEILLIFADIDTDFSAVCSKSCLALPSIYAASFSGTS